MFRQMNNDGNDNDIRDFEVLPYTDVVEGEDGVLSIEEGPEGVVLDLPVPQAAPEQQKSPNSVPRATFE